MFGGFNQLGKDMMIDKAFYGFPAHSQAKFKFKIFKIDQWNGERLSLYVDGKEIWGHNFVVADGFPRDICGSGVNNYIE